MPPVDHECSLLGFVTELADRRAKLEHENAQLKKTLRGARTERSKLPPVNTGRPRRPKRRRRRGARARTRKHKPRQ